MRLRRNQAMHLTLSGILFIERVTTKTKGQRYHHAPFLSNVYCSFLRGNGLGVSGKLGTKTLSCMAQTLFSHRPRL